MSLPRPATPDLQTLVGLFYESPDELGRFVEIAAAGLPSVPRQLLAHNNHMTVAVESFHKSPVDVKVLQTHVADAHYARKILLTRSSDGAVVQFGIMRVDFHYVGPQVRREIESQQTPLGRILIKHNVLREVQLASLWRLTSGPELTELFRLEKPEITYGRTALIFCNGEPAVELLEIVTP